MEMEAENESPPQPNRCSLDGVQQTNIIQWNKKRKLQTDQLDLPRPKHKCWARRFSFEDGSKSDDNLEFASTHKPTMVKSLGETYASALDDISESKSSRGSNSFGEDSDTTSMSVNEEAKLQIDCAVPYLYGRPSHSSREEDRVVERESSYDDDIQALMNLEEHSLALGIYTDHVYSEYVKDGNEHSVGKEFEDVFTTYGANPNMYILSSEKWNVNQEAESSTRPPTIDREFEQYFSMSWNVNQEAEPSTRPPTIDQEFEQYFSMLML